VLQIQNSRLSEIAADGVWNFCAMIMPLRIQGGSGSPVRPVAIGAPTP
jgi:kynurenine formamidase